MIKYIYWIIKDEKKWGKDFTSEKQICDAIFYLLSVKAKMFKPSIEKRWDGSFRELREGKDKVSIINNKLYINGIYIDVMEV